MALEINAQFKQFVQFAEQQIKAGNEKAIARDSGVAAGEGPLAGRVISAATGDKVAKLGWRSKNNKDANNAARNLFLDAVGSMFGGLDRIPKNVRDAMLFKDYHDADGKLLGKPLTARRILKVARAVMDANEPVLAQVSLEQAGSLVDSATAWMNELSPNMTGMNRFEPVHLDDELRDKAARLVVKCGAGLTAANLGVLAGYAAVAVKAERVGRYEDGDADEIVRRLAKTLKNVRNFKPGDPRLIAFDAKMTNYWQALLREQLGPGKAKHYDADGIFDALYTDADRNQYTICGEVFPEGAEKRARLMQTFKNRIANPMHRKALSSFLCQLTGAVTTAISIRDALPPTPGFKSLKTASTKGHDLLLTVDKNDALFQGRNLQGSAVWTYELKLSEDGTKATIISRSSARMKFDIDGAEEFCGVPAGNYEQQLEFDFDLSNPNAVTLTASRLGQTIVPPEAPPA